MQYEITIKLDSDDEEAVGDLIRIVELTAPYMVDNIVVTSKEV